MPSEILVQIRGAYPELDNVPDADLIAGINEQVPEVGAAIRWELGREAKLNLGRERIASETPGEYLIADEQAAAPGALGRVEQFLAPGGRAIARGAGQMITGSLAAQDAFAAAPRVWFGENLVTTAFEILNKPNLAAELARNQARASAERPSYGPQSLSEAWNGDLADKAQFMVERGLEQVPNMAASIGTGGAMAAAGVPTKLAAILGIGATTLPQETGGAYEEIKQVSGNESPATAALVGGLNTGLEMVGDAKMFQRALGGDRIIADTAGKYIRSALGRAAGQGGKEFVTEALQEGVTAGLPYLTGQTEAPQNLGERMLEAGVSALLPGPATSLTTDALGYTQPGALTPPKLTANQIARDAAFEAEQKRQQDRTLLAAQINSARMASQEAQRQAEIDQQLAVQMADVREKANRERALADQYGQLAGAENQIATDQALAEADALLGAMLAKRQSQAMDIPELTPGIAAEPTSTTLRMAEEAQRRASMTPEQRAALEVLERKPEQPDPFNRLQKAPVPDTLSGLNDFGEPTIAPTPVDFAVAGLTPRTQPNQQEFEAGLKNGVPAAPSQPTLQEQRQLGGRYAATPDTTSGLSEQAGETIAPSAVDMLLAEDRGALYPVPSRSDFERGLKNGVPDGTRPAGPSYPVPSSAAFDRGLKSGVAPAPRRTGTFSTDSGIAESQADQAMSPVDQYIAGRRPTQAPPIDTSSGLVDAVNGLFSFNRQRYAALPRKPLSRVTLDLVNKSIESLIDGLSKYADSIGYSIEFNDEGRVFVRDEEGNLETSRRFASGEKYKALRRDINKVLRLNSLLGLVTDEAIAFEYDQHQSGVISDSDYDKLLEISDRVANGGIPLYIESPISTDPSPKIKSQANVPNPDTSSGLSDAVDASGTTPVDDLIAARRAEATGKQSLQVDQGLYEAQQPGGRTPIDNFLSTRKAIRKRSALSRSSREDSRTERAARAKTQLTGSRQQGQMGTISDKFAPLLEQLASRVPPEEQQRAVSGVPETDDGWALRYIINAREEVDRYLSGTGDQVNDNGRTYMERNYQERVLATLQDPKRTKPLRISFPGRTVLKQSLLNVRQNLAEVGNVTGQSEEGIELTGDSGTFENPALADKATQPAGEAAWSTQEPQSHNAVEIIQNFIDTETSTAEEGQAAYNLILTALGQQPLYTDRNTDRQLAERDPVLKAKVAELVRDELRKRILKAHLTGEPRASIGLAAVTAAVRGVTSSDKVQVVYDPDLKDPKGRPVSGYIDAQGKIVINAAFIDSPQMARDVVLEELMHAVYGEADVQQAWDQVRAGVTKAERDAMIAAGYSEDVAVEEAAIRKVIAQINSRNTDNAVTRFLRSVVEAMKRVFGIAGNDPYGVILARALKGGMTSGPRMSISNPDYVVPLDSFDYRDDSDEFLYHVTTSSNLGRIIKDGSLRSGRRGTFSGAAARSNSDGKVFLTERGGVKFWADRIAEQIEASVDLDEDQDADSLVRVVRIPKSGDLSLQADTFTDTQKGRDWYSVKDIPLAGNANSSTRFSLADGYWKSSAELEQDLAFAGDQRTLAEAAAAQKSIIPPSITAEVDAIKARIAAAPTKRDSASDRAAMRILSPIRNMKELLSGAIASNLPSAWSVAAATGLANISEKARDITAEAILKTHLHLLQMGSKTTERAQEMVSKAAEAFAKLPSASRLEIEAEQYRSMAERLAYDFKKNIDERVEIAKGSKDENLIRELAMASRNLTESFRGSGAAVSSALRNIAAQIPDSALATPESARQWIEARVNDKTQPPIMSQIAADWLFTKPDGRLSTPIEWDKRLNERLRLMKELADEKSQISQDIAAFDQSITGTKKRPSVQQIFQKYVQFRDSHRDSMEKMRLIYREIDKAEAELNGSVTAQQVLQKLLADPAYVARVEEARNHLGALSRGVKLPNGNGPGTSPFGKDTYLHPVTGEQVVIDQIPDVGTETKNIEKLRALVKDVQAWMRTSNDPLLRSAWDRELQFIVNKGFAIPPSLQTGFNEFGIRLPSWWQLPFNPVSRTFSMGRLDVANNIWQRVGTRAALRPLQAAQISDRVKKAFEQLAGGNDSSENRIKEKIKAAMTSHGRERLSDIFDWWVPTIVERIISQDQSPTQRPYKVGDYILGHQITREDMDAVEAMKKWQTQASNIVQKNQTLGSYIDPIATEEIVAGRSLVRRSVDYGLKMARTLSDFGRTFTEEFLSADEAGRLEFLDKHFNRTVMGLVHETDGEVAGRLSDMDRAMFIELNKLDRSNALPFADLDGFLDWVGDRAAQTTGRSPADERSEAQARLLDYFEGFATAINNAIGQADRASVEDFEKKGLPVAIVKSVNGGANPFLTPRGRLMGPSTFYQYSMASDGDRGRYKSAAITALTLKEVVEAKNALSAIKRELEKYEGPEGLIAKEQAKGKYRILAKRKVAAESQRRARAREVMIDYRSLVDHKQAVEVTLAGMERLALEHTVSKEDNAIVSASNNIRSGFVSSVLSSIKSAATNGAGGAIMSMQFKRMLGSYNFLIAPAELLYEASKEIAGAVTKGLRTIPGIDPTMQAMAKVPGFDKILTAFFNNQLRYEQNRQKAVAAGLVDEPDWIEGARLKQAFPAGAGRLAQGDDNGIFIQGANRLASLPVLRQLIEFSKSKFPGAMDRLLNTTFSTVLENWVKDINGPALEAWKRRDTGTPGWDEIGNPINVFSAEELGLPDNNVLRAWRQILSPAGGLEKLALDFYKRTKGMSRAALKNESMLTPEQMEAVALESAKMVNLPTGSTTPLIAQGKGLSGTIRRWLTLFQRYPIAAQGFLENISGTAVGDNPRTSWKVMSGGLAFALMLLIGGASMDWGQWMQEVIFNDPRTKASFAQTVDAGTAKDYVKYAAMSMAASYPFLGEQIGNAIGGTSGKPLMDANRMIVPFGLANDAYQVISRTLQTGDAFYPVTDFVRRYSPIAGAGMNMLQPGEVEARAALRAARVAATSDMEIRQTGGQGKGNRESRMTPLVRRASNALLEGNEEAYNAAVEEAVQYQVGQGKTPEAARRSVLSSIASREPARRAFGRQITPEESSAIEARMSPVSRQSYQRSRSAFARFRGTGRKRTALGRSRRTRKPRARRRSALVR